MINILKNENAKKGIFVFFIFLVIIDQLSKHFAKDIFRNYLFAFSLPVPVWLMYFIYVLIAACCIIYVVKNLKAFSLSSALSWALIFAGGICNIVERLLLGYVRDFIYISFYRWTGVYNLADFYILLGIIILLFGNNETVKESHKK